jgi:large subunit ribosomal protein L17
MRHAKHRHQLGRKMEHRTALMANLAMALIKNRRIRTTLAKAKALRPFIEKTITLAKKAYATDDKVKKHHYHRLALARVRNIESVNRLFDVLAEEFVNRAGGYTRIYKLVPRLGDAADIAIIEFISAEDEGYAKRKSKAKKHPKSQNLAPDEETKDEESPAQEEESFAETESPDEVLAEAEMVEEPSSQEEESSNETESLTEVPTDSVIDETSVSEESSRDTESDEK